MNIKITPPPDHRGFHGPYKDFPKTEVRSLIKVVVDGWVDTGWYPWTKKDWKESPDIIKQWIMCHAKRAAPARVGEPITGTWQMTDVADGNIIASGKINVQVDVETTKR